LNYSPRHRLSYFAREGGNTFTDDPEKKSGSVRLKKLLNPSISEEEANEGYFRPSMEIFSLKNTELRR